MSAQPMLNFPPPLPEELAAKIETARLSGKLSDCEADVLDLLTDGPRTGRKLAISIASMQRTWLRAGQHAWDERSVKAAIKELIRAHRLPICSSRDSRNGGYFLPSGDEELEAAERLVRAEIRSRAEILAVFNPRSEFARFYNGQEKLGGEGSAA